ncbi:MAG: hypothetical protein K2Y39_05760 [Candidatus Obscuribacterales bacterium]|nr:hypothetical protein [Candidatus Obscuribacterales bacterium]
MSLSYSRSQSIYIDKELYSSPSRQPITLIQDVKVKALKSKPVTRANWRGRATAKIREPVENSSAHRQLTNE